MLTTGLRPCLRQITCLLCFRMSTPRSLIRRMSYGGCCRIMSCSSPQKICSKSFLIRPAKERLGRSIKTRWILKVCCSSALSLGQTLTVVVDTKFAIEYHRRIRSLRQRFQRVKKKESQVYTIGSSCGVNLSQNEVHIAHIL